MGYVQGIFKKGGAMSRLVVVGGGAAGMLCAIGGAYSGKEVIITEKNEKLGKKLFITGKGRCNVTNIADRDEFFECIASNPRFLYSSFSYFDNNDIMELIERNGVALKVERGGRVFPESDKSSDIIKALKRELDNLNVSIMLNTEVKSICINDGKATGVNTSRGIIEADAVAVCTGGASYKATGSTGDGYRFAKEAGHTVTKLVPSLIPINCSDDFLHELQGLTLKNVALNCKYNNKEVFHEQGEMLFAHFGITGPLVLTLSSVLGDVDFSKVEISIDLKPALDENTLEKRLLRDFDNNKNKNLKSYLPELLPRTMINVFVDRLEKLGMNPQIKIHSITKEQRKIIMDLLKNFSVTPTSYRALDYAIITKGGVKVNEINPKTMESKLINGLYFAGEVLDVDAKTGGFNLQIAFSTGYCAGIGC